MDTKDSTMMIVDKETGLIRGDYRPKDRRRKRPDEYAQVFLSNLCNYYNIRYALHPVIIEILKMMDQNNEIVLDIRKKKIIAQAIGSTPGSLNVMISELKSAGVLMHLEERGNYMVNPNLFGKGNWGKIVSLREKFHATIIDQQTGEKRTVNFEFNSEESDNVPDTNPE